MSIIWIQAFDGPWHVGVKKEMRTPSGELLHTFVVTACRKQQIGGPWGHRTWRYPDAPRPQCKHCAKINAKGEKQVVS
jgi:hypothetical protein